MLRLCVIEYTRNSLNQTGTLRRATMGAPNETGMHCPWPGSASVCGVSHTQATYRVYWKSVHTQKLFSCNMKWHLSDFGFGACAQSYCSCKDSEKHNELFRCPCSFLCGCQVQFKICEMKNCTKALISGKHGGNSHVETVRDRVYQKLSLNQT